MASPGQIGLSRSELEYEVQWRMRQAPSDAARMTDFLNELIVHLIERNNQAIAASLAERERTDMPRGG